MSPEREYRVTFGVSAAPHQAARLRTILRETLEVAGFELTAGVVTAERWLLEAMADPPAPFRDSRGRPEAEHRGKVHGRRDKRGAQ